MRRPSSRVPLRLLALALALLGLVPAGSMLSGGASIAWWGAAVRVWMLWSMIASLLTLTVARLAPTAVDAAMALTRRFVLAPSARTFALVAACVAAGLALYFGHRMFGSGPTTSDELAQLFEARLLTLGRLYARAEAHPEFFSTTMTLELGGRWFGQFPIGGPAVLALGLAFGVPALVNPLLIGVCVVALHRFVAAMAEELVARIAVILFVLSPFVLFMGGSQMNHVATLTGMLLMLHPLWLWLSSNDAAQRQRSAALVGLCIGAIATIRPFDAALVGLAVGVVQLRHALTDRSRFPSIAVQCAAAAIPLAFMLWVNWRTVGHPLHFAYDVLNGPKHRPGFHVSPSGYMHTPARGLALVSSYLWKLDFELLGWPLPALAFVVFTLLAQPKVAPADHLLVALTMAVTLGYVVYWGDGHFAGPRFMFLLTPALVVWVARFPRLVAERARSPLLRRAGLLLVPLMVVVAWTLPVNRAHPYGVLTLSRTFETHAPDARVILDRVAAEKLSHALVFVDDGWHSRLAARMRAIRMRPYTAEQFAFSVDACTLQYALDQLDRSPLTAEQRAEALRAVASREQQATQLPGMAPLDQLALIPGRPMLPQCANEMRSAESGGISYAHMLPIAELDASGALAGDVVYARHFGARNELLRSRFGDRRWYVARVRRRGMSSEVTLEPYSRALASRPISAASAR